MPRTFVIAPNLPYPSRSGADLRTLSVMDSLAARGPVGVFGIGRTRVHRPTTPNVEVWATTSPKAALVHDRSVPDSNWISQPDWVPSDRYFSEHIAEEIAGALADFRPDVVVLEQLVTAGYLEAAQANGAKVVLNAHNVESHLHAQMTEAEESGVRKVIRKHFAERVLLLESRIVRAVQRIWACSEADRALLRAMGSVPVDVVPNGIDVHRYDQVRSRRSSPSSEPVVLFPANFGYEPNVRAAAFIARELAPLVRARWSEARLLLPGRDPQPELVSLCESAGLEIPGAVDDMLPYFLQATVLVVPLFEGGGTRLKILEAFSSGLPVISTFKGVEGLDVEPGVHFLSANRPEEFLEALEGVMRGDHQEVVQRARELVESQYSQEAVSRSVDVALTDLGVLDRRGLRHG